jgi:hypothetical protein
MCFAGVCVGGSKSVASVTSGGVIDLSGTRLEAATVPSWPLVVGDEITTFDSSAVIVFGDKSRVLLDKNSTAVIGFQNGKVMLNMIKGDALGLRHNPELVVLSRGKRMDLVQAQMVPRQGNGFGREEISTADQPKLPGAPIKPPALSASRP